MSVIKAVTFPAKTAEMELETEGWRAGYTDRMTEAAVYI